MKAIFLPGNSIRNKEWVEELEKNLRGIFDKTEIQYYKHWKSEKEKVDVEHEVSVLMNNLSDSKECIIIAKSVGTYIAMDAVKKGIKPRKVIFLGFPYRWFIENNLEKEAEKINLIKVPILFLQNSEDPFCSYEKLLNFLKGSKLKNYKTYKFEDNNTHDYREYKKINNAIQEFLKK